MNISQGTHSYFGHIKVSIRVHSVVKVVTTSIPWYKIEGILERCYEKYTVYIMYIIICVSEITSKPTDITLKTFS